MRLDLASQNALLGTPSAAQSAAFFAEASDGGAVFSVKDDEGFPAPENGEGSRSMPFWSKRSRAEKIISSVRAYQDMKPVEIELNDFIERWLPDLEKDGLLVGISWSGARATGYDLSPLDVRTRLASTKAP